MPVTLWPESAADAGSAVRAGRVGEPARTAVGATTGACEEWHPPRARIPSRETAIGRTTYELMYELRKISFIKKFDPK